MEKTIKIGGPEIKAEMRRIVLNDFARTKDMARGLLGRNHDAEAGALPHFDFDLRMHGFMLRAFTPWLDGVSALEMGCFDGAMTKRLRDIYPDVTVVEASSECIVKAAGRVPKDVLFINQTFETVELERRYDAIFLTHVLEHLDDPVFVLRRCREWLLPDGHIFIAVPNAHAASRQLAAAMRLIELPESVTAAEAAHGHRRTYSMDELLLHIAQAGLDVVQEGGICFKPLANFQFDRAMQEGIVTDAYLDACFILGQKCPGLCASLYAVCK